ncbi:Nitrile hydratase subunit alpha [Seminavis robusta]|uniref:nitrile hydratase n=1 Tax=Seminavis robusta TaxID=568900 RepID=A0A9N8E323_9STRA|nr:Nitrile hydratase subunit alpha [Seminavis robusta]|eukprot:Sro567_g167950.1 Nitrile hydratase subunit alpha (589) ;mRNA; f:22070-23836
MTKWTRLTAATAWRVPRNKKLLGNAIVRWYHPKTLSKTANLSITGGALSTWTGKSSAAFSSFAPIDEGAGQPGLGGVHDVGGLQALMGETIDLSDPTLTDWEQETHALLIVLIQNGYFVTDELRRHIESMSAPHYIARSYYCKWSTAMALGLIERGVISYSELDDELLAGQSLDDSTASDNPAFSIGQRVRVKPEQSMARWRKPHLRSPGYIFGVAGVVDSYEGRFADPSYKAFQSMILVNNDNEDSKVERKDHLYRVKFRQQDVWPEGQGLNSNTHSDDSMEESDTVTVEIYENWLCESSQDDKVTNWEMDPTNALHDSHSPSSDHHHHHHHNHDHDHDHEHLPRAELEQQAVDLEARIMCSSAGTGTGGIDQKNNNDSSEAVVGDRLSAALIALLSKPERLGPNLQTDLRKLIDAMESLRLRGDGTTLVVKAWMDSDFEARLLEDAAAAAMEFNIQTINATAPTKLKVVKSELPSATQPGVHNLITCTLCSCYPLSLLGLSPKWYKSRSFRARAVREPRAMLQDSFGLELPPDQWKIRVHDSTADLRYLVLPPRPPGTEDWTEEELRQLVTRDTMIGVALPQGIIS